MSDLLIVDDELAMRTALEANFRQCGWLVTTAGGVAEGHRRIPARPMRSRRHGYAHGGRRRLATDARNSPNGSANACDFS